jgi:hypothetical protein
MNSGAILAGPDHLAHWIELERPVRHWLADGGGHDAGDRLRARQPDLPPCPPGAAVGKLTLTRFPVQEITLERAAACHQIPHGGPRIH